ncbi:MAG: hypothetical protein R3B40_17365 [Polyangiales bacterium]|nr:hypothetical protein [Myxococcales bacterium]MCB9661265.1 hypothetical protein [Sandaracinaceae bacterium]
MEPATDTLKSKLIATFGVLCVSGMLLRAIVRLTHAALVPITEDMLTPALGAAYVLWLVFQGYTEGYRGFQLRFCPRVVARAVHLGRNPRPLHVLLALPFCLTLFHAPPRKLLARYIFVACLVALITLVRQVPQPYLGIIDGGVVLGLLWGVLGLWWLLIRYLLGYGSPEPTDLPAPSEAESGTEDLDSALA